MGDFALEGKEEMVIMFEEENEMGDQCLRTVTFRVRAGREMPPQWSREIHFF